MKGPFTFRIRVAISGFKQGFNPYHLDPKIPARLAIHDRCLIFTRLWCEDSLAWSEGHYSHLRIEREHTGRTWAECRASSHRMPRLRCIGRGCQIWGRCTGRQRRRSRQPLCSLESQESCRCRRAGWIRGLAQGMCRTRSTACLCPPAPVHCSLQHTAMHAYHIPCYWVHS